MVKCFETFRGKNGSVRYRSLNGIYHCAVIQYTLIDGRTGYTASNEWKVSIESQEELEIFADKMYAIYIQD